MTKVDIEVPDGTYTAVVDAIEDGQVRVFIEQDGSDVTSVTFSADALPESGRHADAVFTVDVDDGEIDSWAYDPDATQARRERAQSRFDRLSRRLSDDQSE